MNNHYSSGETIEVYEDNFVREIKRMSTYLEEYNYIGMDTEFPGVTVKLSQYSNDFYYKSIKANVDELKLIQLGITLCNSKGESPAISTWQFNFHFDIKKDKFSNESLNLLLKSGINFDYLRDKGIHHNLFGEYFIISGLLLNPNIHWISYHGSTDFAYLLKYALNSPLPKTETEFTSMVSLYFPSHYDIKVLIQGKDSLKGGLNKLASVLDINRTGDEHQAGGDSSVTAAVFFSLIQSKTVSPNALRALENVLYGLGEGEDNKETILYTLFEPNVLNNKSEYEQKVNSNLGSNSFAPQQTSNQTYQTSSAVHPANMYYPYMNYNKNGQYGMNAMNGNGNNVYRNYYNNFA